MKNANQFYMQMVLFFYVPVLISKSFKNDIKIEFG
jgi:hypothetical protein